MLNAGTVVFLLDVDNTLLDNDRFLADFTEWLDRWFGRAQRERYWRIFERLRAADGYADYLSALQRFREGLENDRALLQASAFLLEYPFADRLYPNALDVISHLRRIGGRLAILSDGDVVFQPRKILRSGLWEALQGDILISIHKQNALGFVERTYSSLHCVMVDDKPRLLREMKRKLGDRLTTVFVRQGHYANAADAATESVPDLSVAAIGDLRRYELADFAPISSRDTTDGRPPRLFQSSTDSL